MKDKIEEFRELLVSRIALRKKRVEQYDLLGSHDLANAASDCSHRMQEILDKFNELFPKEDNQPQNPGTGTGTAVHGDRRDRVGEE